MSACSYVHYSRLGRTGSKQKDRKTKDKRQKDRPRLPAVGPQRPAASGQPPALSPVPCPLSPVPCYGLFVFGLLSLVFWSFLLASSPSAYLPSEASVWNTAS